nr:uncharacterized protein CI109_007145 [Kwoniella shandongensis]KAA5524545.1 hypothetical protein CI109_007145 [Kwoniella shandongensis]
MSQKYTPTIWDEEIVPTLKRRLETESTIIANRLSATHFDFDQHVTGLLTPSDDNRAKEDSTSFTGQCASSPSQAGPSSSARSKVTSHRSNTQSTSPRRPRRNNTLDPPTPQTSRIPIRPRSKSQTPSPRSMSTSHPPLPLTIPHSHSSGIPILKTRSSPSNQHRPFPSNSPITTSVSVFGPLSGNGRGRDSPDFSGTEGFIKNELPPFRLAPDEAMRIAERGHDLHDGDLVDDDDEGPSGDRGEKRKRAVTMSNGLKVDSRPGYERSASGSSGGSNGSTSGRKNSSGRPSTSGTTQGGKSNLGMGYPSSHRPDRPSRSSSNTGQRTQPSSSKSFTPRSASLNLLASSGSPSNGTSPASRLGVAAHFIPPESSYTPPKGTNWDEVVLPTVAKKLGISSETRAGRGEEDDLAVEWDRDGTPIKWVKRRGGKGLGENGEGNTPSPSALNHDEVHSNRPTAFSPTFEPSPDNPLYSSPSRPPQMRYQRSNEGIELGPIRTTMAHPTTLSNTHVDTFDPRPAATLSKKPSTQSGLGRKASFLRGNSKPEITKQESQMSLRNQAPPQVPGTTHQITDAIYQGSKARQMEKQKRTQTEDDTHGKGCGCVVM